MSRDSLDGILVVSIEQAVAAPYATCRLADAGARVIKVERPEGDFARSYDAKVLGQNGYFLWLNRGKESVVLDLKREDDAALMQRMLARADVLVQNLAPGAAGRLGFDSTQLRQRHPRLITCDISGFGSQGPQSTRRGYDLLVQAESGLASITGAAAEPGRVGVSICDISTGMFAYAGILEALLRRERSGRGSAVESSLFASMADWMTVPLLDHEHSDAPWMRLGLQHPSIVPYGLYPVAGGATMLIGVQNDREFHRLAVQVLEAPELAEDPRFATNGDRVANRVTLDRRIVEALANLDAAAVAARCEAAGIAYGCLSEVADLAGHPQLERSSVATPNGDISIPRPAPRFPEEDARNLGRVPTLGEHSDAVRREFA